MTLTLQILASIVLIMMIYGAVKAEIAIRKESSRLKKKRELRERLQRKLDVLIRDNTRVLYDFFQTGEFDETSAKILEEENREIEEMIQKFERM